MNYSYIRHIILLLAATLTAALAPSCIDELPAPDMPDYTDVGRDVTATFTVTVPQMEVKSRADIDNAGLYAVHSLYVATYSSVTGQITSMDENGNNLGWQKVDVEENPATGHKNYEISIHTKTGPSYIVAVANVENYGITKDDPAPKEPSTIAKHLAAANTWEKFLNIGVAASENQLYAPSTTNGLVMSGIYIGNSSHPGYDGWEEQNFTSYTIPYANGATVPMKDGAIHLRRLVSQVTFNIYTGLKDPEDEKNNNITVTPHSYTVYNAPNHSWLYERGDASAPAIQNRKNFDDNCTADTKGTLYRTQAFSSQYISASEGANKRAIQTFNFWMTENKHTATGVADYNARNAYTTPTEGGDKIFTALNSAWTKANMATYVVINCTVEYNYDKDNPKPPLTVDPNGNPDKNGDGVYRSGTGNFIVHLGYVDEDLNDFNCYRNVDYNYNVYINGLDDIRVEATATTKTNGVEGIVTDMEEKTIFLDCHYHQFNVYLTDEELKAWKTNQGGSSEGFGFIITTYDNLNGGVKTFDESYFIDNFKNADGNPMSYDDIIKTTQGAALKKYVDWVEFAPTSGEFVYATYKPRNPSDKNNTTFNLIDASQGLAGKNTKYNSSKGWYTCFVKEYTYDYGSGSDESVFVNGHPQWFGYVNADPRQFYIRVTKAMSSDGQSVYARAKYGTQQKSILSYYSTDHPTTSTETDKENGSAIGIEHTNETYGLKLRSRVSDIKPYYSDAFADDLSSVNGRYNCYQFTRYLIDNDYGGYWFKRYDSENVLWSDFIYTNNNTNVPLTVPYAASTSKDEHHVPRLQYAYRLESYTSSIYDPNPGETNINNYIEAISACMNRNRDINGDGYIDPEEIRWYVPTTRKYIRMIVGTKSLGSEALLDFTSLGNRPSGDPVSNDNSKWGAGLFYASDNQILWAMEGMSTGDYGKSDAYPWQVRCIRSLGINLTNVTKNDKTIPAYTIDKKSDGSATVKPNSYSTANLRPDAFTGNGTGTGQMPVHRITDKQYNSIYINGFEIEPEPTANANNVITGYNTVNNWTTLRKIFNNEDEKVKNRCTEKGNGWRLPNITELAIIYSEKLIEDQYYKYNGENQQLYNISCSVTPYNDKGEMQKLDDDETNKRTRNILKASGKIITQGDAGRPFMMRCVRDITN